MDMVEVFRAGRIVCITLQQYQLWIDSNDGFDKKIGEYEDNDGKNVFTETWTDKHGNSRAPIAPEKDFSLFFYPRSILLGVKIEF